MRAIFSFCVLCVTSLCHAHSDPFPKDQLPSSVFNAYLPEIMEEVNQEFSLQDDQRTKRNTREYGYSFFEMENGNFTLYSIPHLLKDLGKEICKALGFSSHEFTNIILSVYEEGFHLEPHVDTNEKDHLNSLYYFDENVFGIIIEADPTGHLYFIQHDTNETLPSLDPTCSVYDLDEQDGTIFCLQGKYRFAPYNHGVTQVANRRISITFRKVIIKQQN